MQQGFGQLPQRLRILASSSLSSEGLPPHSDFLELVYKPLTSLTVHKRINPSSKMALLQEILRRSFIEMNRIIGQVIFEEEKVEQSLLKYA